MNDGLAYQRVAAVAAAPRAADPTAVAPIAAAAPPIPVAAPGAVGAARSVPVAAPVVPPPTRPARRASVVGALVQTARPRQWVKNVLVFAAPGAAGVLTDPAALARTSLAFGVFCLAASGTYFFNDTADRHLDRQHPVKRLRPVAAGEVSGGLAVATGAVLSGLALFLAATLGLRTALAVAVYLAINVAYNLRLGREPVLDLAAVASGFVIRAIVGGLAAGVLLSEWFLVVISFASLFVVAGKRQAAADACAGGHAHRYADSHRHAAADACAGGHGHRHADSHEAGPRVDYPPAFLRYVRLLASGVALTAYCLWALEKAAVAHGGVWFQLTIVPFALAILRYALLVEQDGERAPEDLLLGDRTMVVLIAGWTALFAIGVYGV